MLLRLVLKAGEDANRDICVVALADAGAEVPEWIQVLPAGEVQSKRGEFVVDEDASKMILAWWKTRANDLVIDYEHQTLGEGEAPAAGWIKDLAWRGKDGLWGKVEWTARGKQYLTGKEYRYLSPVVLIRRSDGRAVALHSAALTNTPAIDGMVPLVNKNKEETQEGKQVDLIQKLRKLLGLGDDVPEDEVLAAVNALKDKPEVVAHKEVLALLDCSENAALADVKGKVIALKNPSGYVKAEEFQTLKDALAKRDRDDLVAEALKSGKVTPASKTWAEEYALKDAAGFKSFLTSAPQVVPLKDIAGGDGSGAHKDGATDEVQLGINKMLGVSDEDYKKYGGVKDGAL